MAMEAKDMKSKDGGREHARASAASRFMHDQHVEVIGAPRWLGCRNFCSRSNRAPAYIYNGREQPDGTVALRRWIVDSKPLHCEFDTSRVPSSPPVLRVHQKKHGMTIYFGVQNVGRFYSVRRNLGHVLFQV